MTSHKPDPVRPLSEKERHLVETINRNWTREKALFELKAHLQVAIEVELATIPIYLYAYYSIERKPAGFPDTATARFADKAGAVIMSVAVEEMLHMSLSSNVLFSLGTMPQLYLKSPAPYPTDLPGHQKLGPDHKPMLLPLAPFSRELLWNFLEIEYPATSDAPPEGGAWKTIGQIYSYVRCIIHSDHIKDEDFHKGALKHQIQPTNYSPNNIDTVYPERSFNFGCPVPASAAGSISHATGYTSNSDAHAGKTPLITIDSRERALQAIETIDAEGEGFGPEKFDDQSHAELSHYYKFLKLQSQLHGYDPHDEKLPRHPAPPAPAHEQFGAQDLSQFVYAFPENPVATSYPGGMRDLADVVSGLYQYMLIMTESIFLQEPARQKVYFNQSLHRSMIWILDKLIQQMRLIYLDANPSGVASTRLAPTFENIQLGPRHQAFANLTAMTNNFVATYGTASWCSSDLLDYIKMIPTLVDVSALWNKPHEAACDVAKYKGIPKFPGNPPATLGSDEVRHACMGLNECKNQGRTQDNACAGQGYCSTALAYNYGEPGSPSVQDHTCHVKNNCAGQGGCGLYGTDKEQDIPGANDCATLGSCATPINAERFSTAGPNRGKGVWLRARKVFEEKWNAKRAQEASLPALGSVPHPDLFQYGPTIEWIHDYSGEGMTACGASGLSGAGSCS